MKRSEACRAIFRFATYLCVLAVPGMADETRRITDEQVRFFESRVRPILVDHCLSCHGEGKQESGLRLDSPMGLRRGGLRGPAIQEREPEKSLILRAISYEDDDLKMPPSAPLGPQARADLERWILAGAFWPEHVPQLSSTGPEADTHWAFQPVVRPPLPQRSSSWATNPVDVFIDERLARADLEPSPPADRRTLIRRLYFDLLGIPPSPDEVAAFLADTAPDAYERLVDRLLASPQYGERWARHWLDVARYADTKGYVFFEDERYPWAFTYRDYVIRALNKDLPYNYFIMEQLAADLLSSPKTGSHEDHSPHTHVGIDHSSGHLAALGFLTIGGHFMNNTHDIIDDRIDVVMRGIQGLTFTCARCHDHKYDPFSQEEYYSMYGIFASCYEPMVPPLVDKAAEMAAGEEYVKGLQEREHNLVQFVTEHHRQLVDDARRRASDYMMAAYRQRFHPPTDDFMLITDKGDLNPAMILRWHAYLHDSRQVHATIWRPWRALAELRDEQFCDQAAAVLRSVVDGPEPINPLVVKALGELGDSFTMADVASAYGRLLVEVDRKWRQMVEQARSAGTEIPQQLPLPEEEEIREVLYGSDSPADVPMMLDWGFLSLFPDRATQEEYKKLLKELEQWLMREGAPPRAMVLYDSSRPVMPRVFLRGNPNRPGKTVPRALPRLLDTDKMVVHTGSGRRELAQALASKSNPLTARVMVNRLWMHHFGRGLVETVGDFGLRGEKPSHPELLDWLAAEFMELDGEEVELGRTLSWSVKRVQRLIVTSATYRQSSRWRPEGAAIDPDNRLWWRAPMRRLDFEAQRDALLVVADGWDRQVGGPSVDIWQNQWVPRRTLYGYLNRLNMPPLSATFDVPSPASSTPQRPVTTTSLQALYWLNNPIMFEAAHRIVHRPDVQHVALPSERICLLYRLLFAREPQEHEVVAALEYLGDSPSDEDWQRYVHALLMTNEFVLIP